MSERSDDILDIFVSAFAESSVLALAQEMAQPIDVVVSQVEGGRLVQRRKFAAPLDGSNRKRATGEVRVKFRVSDGSGSFSTQAIFEGLAEGTGFSGFAARGRLHRDDVCVQVRVVARTNRYNVWEWDSAFRCWEG